MNVVKLVSKKIKIVKHPLTLTNIFSEQRVLTTSNNVFLENNEEQSGIWLTNLRHLLNNKLDLRLTMNRCYFNILNKALGWSLISIKF